MLNQLLSVRGEAGICDQRASNHYRSPVVTIGNCVCLSCLLLPDHFKIAPTASSVVTIAMVCVCVCVRRGLNYHSACI